MEYPKLDFLGDKVSSGELSVRNARDITAALLTGKINFVKLVGCFRHTTNESETVVVDMEVERGQRTI